MIFFIAKQLLLLLAITLKGGRYQDNEGLHQTSKTYLYQVAIFDC